MTGSGPAEAIVTLAEAQAFARVESGEEEALLAGLIRSASALCEAFLGQIVIAREFADSIPATRRWQRLPSSPVRSIEQVADGSGAVLPAQSYSTDIDSRGDGWVRVDAALTGPVRVTGTAGMATSQNEVPEPIRHGVSRLVSHLFASRDGDGGEVPAAVTALWRPYRRLGL
jgi:uncharacterized phiE125 gp8 family phage protein